MQIAPHRYSTGIISLEYQMVKFFLTFFDILSFLDILR